MKRTWKFWKLESKWLGITDTEDLKEMRKSEKHQDLAHVTSKTLGAGGCIRYLCKLANNRVERLAESETQTSPPLSDMN